MTDRGILITWCGIFLTLSSVSWAIAFAHVYTPVDTRTAKEICAVGFIGDRNTPFCMEIAKQVDGR